MIAQLTGRVSGVRDGALIVVVGGVGYKVSMTSYGLGKVVSLEEVTLHIHTYVREDILALYGFVEEAELKIFELLIGVSGIGPKAALSILSIADVASIQAAIANEDASILTRVSGVGKKTADRVVLELKNKVADMGEIASAQATGDSEAMEALVSMGYTVSDAREALKSVPNDVNDVGEKVKLALRGLGKSS